MTVAAGDRLFEQGTPATAAYFVETGELELLAQGGSGESRIGSAVAGDPVGELDAIAGTPYAYAVRAVSDATLLAVDRDTLLGVIAARPDVGAAILRRLASRARSGDRPEPAVTVEAAGVLMPAAPAASPPPRPRLLHVASGKEVALPEKAEISVGRGGPHSRRPVDVDLSPFDDARSVSRRHGWLLREGDEVYVREEAGAANGTFVNGVRLTAADRALLHPGDEVRFGHAVLVYRADAG